ncbi:MAG TPA: GntR family transcriptional regulator [Bryobacteraceae bacterium]|nr:GntR family transcriptional regulator [Bryobacteraceae bacterium]
MSERALRLRIDLSNPVPAYRQIVDGLRTLLVDGALRPGDLLPPVRELAFDLGVHFNTVAEAYRILAEEGWLDLKRRRGAQVLARSKRAADPQKRAQFARRIREMIAELKADGVRLEDIRRELNLVMKGLDV